MSDFLKARSFIYNKFNEFSDMLIVKLGDLIKKSSNSLLKSKPVVSEIMSKLTKCDSCQTEIAIEAKSCPKCGAPNKKPGCLKLVFGVVLAVVSVLILIAAGSTDKDSEGDSAPKEAQTSSKKGSSVTDERAKLKVKGVYIGMQSDELVKTITPVIKQMCTGANAPLKSENLFDSAGKFLPDAIATETHEVGNQYGNTTMTICPKNADENLLTLVYFKEDGKVSVIEFNRLFFASEGIPFKDYVQQFVNAYKLALIGPKALLKSGGPDDAGAEWICDLPIGVEVVINKFKRNIGLLKSESDAEKSQKIENSRKAFN